MLFIQQERTCLFIDGTSLYTTSRNLGFDVDYRSLLQFFRKRCTLLRAYYYAALVESEDYSPVRPLTDWLAYNGYAVVIKSAREFTDHAGRKRIRGDVEVEMTVDMLEMTNSLQHMVIFSGNGDLRRAVEAAQRCGTRVSVVSSLHTTPPYIADELRRQADQFIDLMDLAPEITRRPPDNRPRNSPPVRHPADYGSEQFEET